MNNCGVNKKWDCIGCGEESGECLLLRSEIEDGFKEAMESLRHGVVSYKCSER